MTGLTRGRSLRGRTLVIKKRSAPACTLLKDAASARVQPPFPSGIAGRDRSPGTLGSRQVAPEFTRRHAGRSAKHASQMALTRESSGQGDLYERASAVA